ncbi:MAG: kelch repeat-containing protein [bacterium]
MKNYFNLHRRGWMFYLLSLFLLYGIAYSEWSPTKNLNTGRSGFECAGLNNGKVMVMGGLNDYSNYELFDPATGIWTKSALPAMSSHDLGILIGNGKILYLDGSACNFWFYDPITQIWSSAGVSLAAWDSWNCYNLMKNGKVLIPYDGQHCQIYDPAGNSLSATGSTVYNHGSGVQLNLPNGNVLLAGGGATASKIVNCEIYDPVLGTWSQTASMAVARKAHVGVLLPPPWEKVLMTAILSPTQLYDPAAGTWATTGPMSTTARSFAAMALLPCGKVLMAGGTVEKTCELYDPAAGAWTMTDSMMVERDHFSLAILYTGKVLAMGTQLSGFPPQSEIYDPSQGIFANKTTINTGRRAAAITALPIIHTSNCSTNVLITGGENGSGTLNSCELYNYQRDVAANTGSLNTPRSYHTITLLPSSGVLVAGGKNASTPLNSSETFNLLTEVWTNSGTMTDTRFDHTATLLKDGRVLVTGGENGSYLNSCETYSGGVWTTVNPMSTARARHSAVLLLNGNILVIGGETAAGTPTNTCELWDGTNWTNAASMANARNLHTTTLLQSGKVLVIGGKGAGGTALNTCEVYNPATNTWSSEGNLNSARYAHNAILLYSGLVLVTGGTNGTNSISSCEIWDPAAGFDSLTNKHEWKVTASLTTPRAYHSSILLPYLKPYVYTIGGFDGTSYVNSIEQYDVGLGYQDIWQSTITNYPSITPISATMNIQGTLFRGVSEADGGNYCHKSSNDHPIISLVRVGGGNWQGNGGGEIMNMPNSTSWDTAHTNVSLDMSDFQGHYKLWSIVNGIPCKWYKQCAGIEDKSNLDFGFRNAELTAKPNPFVNKTVVSISLAVADGNVGQGFSLAIYDIAGKLVKTLSPINDSRLTNNEIKWDGKDNKGKNVRQGIYFVRNKSKGSLKLIKLK